MSFKEIDMQLRLILQQAMDVEPNQHRLAIGCLLADGLSRANRIGKLSFPLQ